MTSSNSNGVRRRRKIRFERTKFAVEIAMFVTILTLAILLIRVIYNIFTPVYIGMNEAIVNGAARNGFSHSTSEDKTSKSVKQLAHKKVNNIEAVIDDDIPVIDDEIPVIDDEDANETNTDTTEEKTDPENNFAALAAEPLQYIDEYTDLKGAKQQISEKDIETVILRFTEEGSALREEGVAAAYIEASRKTGYDPIFLLALTACEAGWNVSYDHSSRSNPYSIGMWDDSFDHGSVIGNTFAEGIVNGAEINYKSWYLERECHSLHSMQNYFDGYTWLYYASNPEWEYMVSDVMNMIYSYINEYTDKPV